MCIENDSIDLIDLTFEECQGLPDIDFHPLVNDLEDSFRIVFEYWQGFRKNDVERMQNSLSKDIILECPSIGRIVGIKAHLDLFRKNKRYPNMIELRECSEGYFVNYGFLSYYMYTEFTSFFIIDQFTIIDGLISSIKSTRSPIPCVPK